MRRILPLSAVISLLAAGGAYAQYPSGGSMPGQGPGPATPPTPDTRSPAIPDTPAQSASGLKVGMTVKDSAGATVGKITEVGQTSDGTSAVAISVDGKKAVVPASTLKLAEAGSEATSSQTKAQIKAAAAANPG
ncbi:MAG TPA: hypothetical protein VGG29_05640 [Caulobacteraceae bacterium]|jgi:hypothetical protein